MYAIWPNKNMCTATLLINADCHRGYETWIPYTSRCNSAISCGAKIGGIWVFAKQHVFNHLFYSYMQNKCAVKWIILNCVDFQCKWASFSPKLINMSTCLGSLYQYLFLCWRNILSMDVYCTQACAETACRLSCSIMGNVFGCVHVHNKCSHTMLCVI